MMKTHYITCLLILCCVVACTKNPTGRHLNKASGMLKKKDYTNAILEYDKALQIDSTNPKTLFLRATAKSNSKDFSGAIPDYTRVIELSYGDIKANGKAFVKFADVFFQRGAARHLLLDTLGALEDYNKAIAINKYHYDAYCNRGMVKYLFEDKSGALSDYNIALKIRPRLPNAYVHRGLHKNERNDIAGALEDYYTAIRYRSKSVIPFNNVGFIKLNKGEYEDAILYLNKAILIDSTFTFAYNNRGDARFKLEDKKGACLDWMKAEKLGSKEAKESLEKHCAN